MYVLLNMCIIFGLLANIGYVSYMLGEMRYSLYCIAARALQGDHKPFRWLQRNSFFAWYIVVRLAMIGTVLTMIGQFMRDNIFVRPNFVFICGSILWVSIFFMVRHLHKKANG